MYCKILRIETLWTDFSASCQEINWFEGSRSSPNPVKPKISLALVQTCIEHVCKGNRILIQVIISAFCPSVPLNDIHILTISHCSTVRVSSTSLTLFDAGV